MTNRRQFGQGVVVEVVLVSPGSVVVVDEPVVEDPCVVEVVDLGAVVVVDGGAVVVVGLGLGRTGTVVVDDGGGV